MKSIISMWLTIFVVTIIVYYTLAKLGNPTAMWLLDLLGVDYG